MKGKIYRVAGPVVTVIGIKPKMYDVVKVGHEGLMGEVIRIEKEKATVQVYEDTSGIEPGEPVENTGMPLSVELGPGLLESIYDGIQRPLKVLEEKMGNFIERGVTANGLDREKNGNLNLLFPKEIMSRVEMLLVLFRKLQILNIESW